MNRPLVRTVLSGAAAFIVALIIAVLLSTTWTLPAFRDLMFAVALVGTAALTVYIVRFAGELADEVACRHNDWQHYANYRLCLGCGTREDVVFDQELDAVEDYANGETGAAS